MNSEQIFKDDVSEALFRQAVIDDFNRRIAEAEQEAAKEKHVFSERHERQMKKLFARERRKESLQRTFRRIRKASIAVAAAFTSFGLLLWTVPEVRAAVTKTVVKFFDKFAQFDGGAPATENIHWHLSYLPEGYAETSNMTEGFATFISYSDTSGTPLSFDAVPADASSIAVNNEGVIYGQTIIDGLVYHTFTADSDSQGNTVVWDKDGYRLVLGGGVSIDTLLKMAQSVAKD
ncbi:hypothetical protein FACS1894111_00050 [Clostridia bacterium]|nr:hypothetical protein FACS1894111_00050 [Clostridia bacterium]